MSDFYSLQFTTLQGETYQFSQLKGKVVLLVNVASKCGFTPQYKQLQKLHDQYHSKGLEILGFPSNQFASQEPGTNEDIQEFCQKNYGVDFTMMAKSDVNGDKENPVYHYIKAEKPGLMGLKRIKWNFEKFLVNKDGKVVSRYASTTSPMSLAKEIEELLGVEGGSEDPKESAPHEE